MWLFTAARAPAVETCCDIPSAVNGGASRQENTSYVTAEGFDPGSPSVRSHGGLRPVRVVVLAQALPACGESSPAGFNGTLLHTGQPDLRRWTLR